MRVRPLADQRRDLNQSFSELVLARLASTLWLDSHVGRIWCLKPRGHQGYGVRQVGNREALRWEQTNRRAKTAIASAATNR